MCVLTCRIRSLYVCIQVWIWILTVVYRCNPTILHPRHQHAPKPFTPDVPRPASSSVPWVTTLGQAGGLQRSRRVGPMRASERSVGRKTLMQDELFNWCWHGFAWGPPICQPALCEIIVVCPSPSLLVALCIDPLLSLRPLLSSLPLKSSRPKPVSAPPRATQVVLPSNWPVSNNHNPPDRPLCREKIKKAQDLVQYPRPQLPFTLHSPSDFHTLSEQKPGVHAPRRTRLSSHEQTQHTD